MKRRFRLDRIQEKLSGGLDMTPPQIENFRRVLVATIGPMALTFSDERIQVERDLCQAAIDRGEEHGGNLDAVGLKERPPTDADRVRMMAKRRKGRR